ncbi:MAG: methyltransferase domain-containing protein [Erythrobacter sp.]|nr:methyltransferase domain-containing protein [Erythrobacter sp.]
MVIAENAMGEIVFVNSREGGRGWELPGGEIEKGETPERAAIREFREETGGVLTAPEKVGVVLNKSSDGERTLSQVHMVVGTVQGFDGKGDHSRLMSRSTPEGSSFDADWIDGLIDYALEARRRMVTQRMWEATAAEYADSVRISDSDVHYGPLLPGEASLALLPDLTGARVLDLGCGSGHNLRALASKGAQSGLGLDFATRNVDLARRQLPSGMDVALADIVAWAQDEDDDFGFGGDFDLVLAVFSVAFVADISALFNRVAQVLKPNGIVVISTDHPQRGEGLVADQRLAPANDVTAFCRTWRTDAQAYSFYQYMHSRAALVEAMSSAGLKLEAELAPAVLPLEEAREAPYFSDHYLTRYDEMAESPYTLILKARQSAA